MTKHRLDWGRYALAWGALLLLSLLLLAGLERRSLVRELTLQSGILHRLASQRADQHDAHLTALSAILVAGGADRPDLFLDVAATVTRFYPRIRSVSALALEDGQPDIPPTPRLSVEDRAQARELARVSRGALQLGKSRSNPEYYLLVKRSPNSDAARHALVLEVDAAALVASDDMFWHRPSASRRLFTPDGALLTGEGKAGDALIKKPLGSTSQPLLLETALAISPADVLPADKVIGVTVLVTFLYWFGVIGLRQRSRRKDAESRAELSAQETRLAHASRVNAMGEMASGMAHELAQPLTAILSQAQAGRHLARRGDASGVASVLDDTVSQAQRAANILDRLRRWSKPNRVPETAVALNKAVETVRRLLAAEARATGAEITLDLSDAPLLVDADPVELEQVVFNLVRNALDAAGQGHVTLRTLRDEDFAVLEVSDDGPGVPEAIRDRIFDPFVTSKTDGTGLGLALCQRLVDEMGGDIVLLPVAGQTTFRLSLPISAL